MQKQRTPSSSPKAQISPRFGIERDRNRMQNFDESTKIIDRIKQKERELKRRREIERSQTPMKRLKSMSDIIESLDKNKESEQSNADDEFEWQKSSELHENNNSPKAIAGTSLSAINSPRKRSRIEGRKIYCTLFAHPDFLFIFSDFLKPGSSEK